MNPIMYRIVLLNSHKSIQIDFITAQIKFHEPAIHQNASAVAVSFTGKIIWNVSKSALSSTVRDDNVYWFAKQLSEGIIATSSSWWGYEKTSRIGF